MGEDVAGRLEDLDVPPRGNLNWYRHVWSRPHEVDYVVQIVGLDGLPDRPDSIITTVLICLIRDAQEYGLDVRELLEDAYEAEEGETEPR